MIHEMYAVEYANNIPTRIHVFKAEADTQQSDYRALVSMGAFDRRMGLICARDLTAKRFWLKRKFEWEQLVESDRRMMRLRHSPIWINLPKQIHEDLWSFYRAVGWDYKQKKFVDQKSTISATTASA